MSFTRRRGCVEPEIDECVESIREECCENNCFESIREECCGDRCVESECESFHNARCFWVIWKDRNGRCRCKCCHRRCG